MKNRRHIRLFLLLVTLGVIAVACGTADPPIAGSPTSFPTATPTATPSPTPTPTPTPVPTPTPTPVPPTRRAIIIQGVCSSSFTDDIENHWVNTVKDILTTTYDLTDLPTGHPDDQVIEYGYSVRGWDEVYEPLDTLKSVAASSAGLRDIYADYPNSEFFIIGHSLGGVIALDGLARYSEADSGMISSTAAVITVSSPVRGLRDRTAEAAGAAIELVACRQFPQLDGASGVWDDLARSGESISLIHNFDWSPVRIVNFGNVKDLVVDVETATFPELFEVSCYSEGGERFLQLNHDILLGAHALAEELLGVLMNGDEPGQGCER